jgi:hypothetical protein
MNNFDFYCIGVSLKTDWWQTVTLAKTYQPFVRRTDRSSNAIILFKTNLNLGLRLLFPIYTNLV